MGEGGKALNEKASPTESSAMGGVMKEANTKGEKKKT